MDIVREKVLRVGDLQWGRVSSRQLQDLGADRARITRWTRNGYLRRVLPRVYAVGHIAESVEADLIAAVLYAGPGAMLSHATALWWHGLVERRPACIEVSTPLKRRSQPGIQVHSRRSLGRLPTTTVAQALLDFAATEPPTSVVQALAEADYRRALNLTELEAICGPGRPGAVNLKRALAQHTPKLAKTKSKLERAFHALCRRGAIPPYEVNHRVCGFIVDAFWPDLGVVVELDGVQGHATPAQRRRDRPA